MLQTNYEPFSSVSFQHKPRTSPYPTQRFEDESSTHFPLFKDPLPSSSSAGPTSLQVPPPPPPSASLGFLPHLRRRPRRLVRRRHVVGVVSVILLALFVWRHTVAVYYAFARIKLNHTLLESGYLPCGIVRKDPMVHVLDSHHVQLVWEMNCDMNEMHVAWRPMDSTSPPEDWQWAKAAPSSLAKHHVLYKATLTLTHPSATKYRYRLHTAADRKKAIRQYDVHWRLHQPSNKRIRIAALADNQFGLRSFLRLLAHVPQYAPDYLLHAGDAVQQYPSLQQWHTDFAAPLTYYGLAQHAPMIYAHGNHDHDPTFAYHYTRASHGQPWHAFSLADGAIRFLVLDSNLDWQQQDDWLRHELQSDACQQAIFRMVVVHIPPFLEYWDPVAWTDGKESEWGRFVKERYVPLFEEHGVDLVISGHQHNYERGERNGIMYTIIGGAGGDIDLERVNDFEMYTARHLDFHFVLIDFEPNGTDKWTLVWRAFDKHGQPFDTHTVHSRSRPAFFPLPNAEQQDDDRLGAVAPDVIQDVTLMDLDANEPDLSNDEK
ncbi:Metallo-dependent phosphatase-like protein [Gongronella butleri]|nr:Metallo-dependent phosphatase-like protein [Gongronella butleri]